MSLSSAIIRMWSRIYTLKLSQWLRIKRNAWYTKWISNFIGEVGRGVVIQRPLLLEGDGLDSIHIGDGTTIHSHCVLGCRRSYGTQKMLKERRAISGTMTQVCSIRVCMSSII